MNESEPRHKTYEEMANIHHKKAGIAFLLTLVGLITHQPPVALIGLSEMVRQAASTEMYDKK